MIRTLLFRGLIFLPFFAVTVHAAPKLNEVREMSLAGRTSDASKDIERALKNAKDAERDEWLYLKAWNAANAGQFSLALETTDELLKGKPVLEEEARALRGQALEKLGRAKEAIEEEKRLLEMSPNFQLRFDAMLRIGRLRFAEGKVRDARNTFNSLERRARGTPGHADVMIELARAEKKLGATSAACRWYLRLYEKHPLHPALKDWGPDLAANTIDGERTGCRNSREDFRVRVRALMWSGEDQKARQEVQEVAQAVGKEDRYAADEMRAWFLLQNGEPDEAFTILQGAYPKRKSDRGFLGLYASAAARSGNSAAAVGAFHRIYEIAGKTAAGRKALYQSASLSYQFRDYDGASRRFKEFIAKYPRSGLSRDAEWNIAWVSYLKGDYQAALRSFGELAARKGNTRDRARYWMAMSHLRLEQTEKARALFSTLAGDRSGSYYGVAARQRLAKLPALKNESEKIDVFEGPRMIGPAFLAEVLMPGLETSFSSSSQDVSEEAESEESLAASVDDPAEPEDGEEASTDIVQETGRSDILEDANPLKVPANAKRLERAQTLLKMGFYGDAKWELFEIERRTRGRDELKALVAAYEEAGQFHRSSSIAQLRFGAQRLAQGFDGARQLWESAYPRAFLTDVRAGAKANGLPEEFIWGIMKAESQFRRDAVSPVGALGLMQIMPGTGRKIASLRKEAEFSPSKLLEPPVAVSFGSFYLNRLSKVFDGSIPLTAAAYNAGPHRVHSWLLSFGSLDMDEFIEHIPFLETREYVRKVVANSFVYSSLYSNRKDLVDLAAPQKVQGQMEQSRKESWD